MEKMKNPTERKQKSLANRHMATISDKITLLVHRKNMNYTSKTTLHPQAG